MDFLIQNWHIILSFVLFVVSTIIAAVRKKPQTSLVDYVVSRLVVFVPEAINAVEFPGNGETKKRLVINQSLKFIVDIYGRSLTEDETNFYSSLISGMIEKFLSTPQKKGEDK